MSNLKIKLLVLRKYCLLITIEFLRDNTRKTDNNIWNQ